MFYQITYDHTQYINPDSVHAAILALPGVQEWWHFLPNVYIVQGDNLTEQQIADHLITIFNDIRFLVAKIDIEVTNGQLPKSAWDWINNKANSQRALRFLGEIKHKPLRSLLSPIKPRK